MTFRMLVANKGNTDHFWPHTHWSVLDLSTFMFMSDPDILVVLNFCRFAVAIRTKCCTILTQNFRHVFVQFSNCNPGCCSCMTHRVLEGVLIFACWSRGPTKCPTQTQGARETMTCTAWTGLCASFTLKSRFMRLIQALLNIFQHSLFCQPLSSPCAVTVEGLRTPLACQKMLHNQRNTTAITVAVVVNATAVSATKVWQRLHRLWIFWPMTIYSVQMSRGSLELFWVVGEVRGWWWCF